MDDKLHKIVQKRRFAVRSDKQARKGRNPMTGDFLTLPPRRVVVFRV